MKMQQFIHIHIIAHPYTLPSHIRSSWGNSSWFVNIYGDCCRQQSITKNNDVLLIYVAISLLYFNHEITLFYIVDATCFETYNMIWQ